MACIGRLGAMRLGAPCARLGFFQPTFYVSVGGVDRSMAGVRIDGFVFTDELDHAPNNLFFRASGFTPATGHEVKVFLGDRSTAQQIFGGHILSLQQLYEADNPANVAYDCTCIDYTWRLSDRPVITRYVNQSASAILVDLIARWAPSFTTGHVVAALPVLDEITFTNEELGDAITRVMERVGGYWYVDYAKDLHAFLTETETAAPITQAAPRTTREMLRTVDLSQVATRVTARGGGSNAAADAPAGATTLPLEDGAWYAPAGGVVECGPQRIAYTGLAGDTPTGSIVAGATTTAPGAPSLALNLVVGKLTPGGVYRYKTTFILGGGETLPSAAAGPVTASLGVEWTTPGTPAAAATSTPGNLVGVYAYKVAFVIRGGETPAGAASSAVTATLAGADGSGVTFTTQSNATAGLPVGTTVRYRYAFITAAGDGPAGAPTPVFTSVAVNRAVVIAGVPIGPAGTTGRRQYRSVNGGTWLEFSSAFYTTSAQNTSTGELDEGGATGSTGSRVPTDSGSQLSLTAIPLGPTGTTARRIYRTTAGGSAFKRVASINDNTTTVLADNVADVSLGDLEPAASSVLERASKIDVTAIALGPAGTTARRLYRTEAGGTIYKRVASINDNVTTAYLDDDADGSLGDEAPASSGVPALAGTTTLQVVDLAPFPASGWVWAGAQLVRYTSRSGSSGPGTLGGIPASGAGAILSPVSLDAEVINAPHLIGVTGILFPILKGDPVNIIVTVNDLAAQAALAAWLASGDGVREMFLSDGRWSITEAGARATTELTQRKDPNVTVTFTSRDPTILSGRSVTIALTSPPISGTFKIQRVAFSGLGFNPTIWPLRQVEASSRKYSFEDLLRQIKGRAA